MSLSRSLLFAICDIWILMHGIDTLFLNDSISICACVPVCVWAHACACVCMSSCVCLSVCVWAHACAWVCVLVCVHACACVYAHACACVCMSTCVCLMCVCLCVWAHACACVCMSTCVCLSVCVLVHVHVCIQLSQEADHNEEWCSNPFLLLIWSRTSAQRMLPATFRVSFPLQLNLSGNILTDTLRVSQDDLWPSWQWRLTLWFFPCCFFEDSSWHKLQRFIRLYWQPFSVPLSSTWLYPSMPDSCVGVPLLYTPASMLSCVCVFFSPLAVQSG